MDTIESLEDLSPRIPKTLIMKLSFSHASNNNDACLIMFDSLGLAPFALCHFASGQDDEEPEYGDLSYLAMLWCSGVGIGLIFYGASEPLMHAVDGTNRALGRICLHICLHVLWDRTGSR